jgi:hypothetical protein
VPDLVDGTIKAFEAAVRIKRQGVHGDGLAHGFAVRFAHAQAHAHGGGDALADFHGVEAVAVQCLQHVLVADLTEFVGGVNSAPGEDAHGVGTFIACGARSFLQRGLRPSVERNQGQGLRQDVAGGFLLVHRNNNFPQARDWR